MTEKYGDISPETAGRALSNLLTPLIDRMREEHLMVVVGDGMCYTIKMDKYPNGAYGFPRMGGSVE